MKGDASLVNIQFKDNTVKRLVWKDADELVKEGKAKFINKSIYRSLTRTVEKPSEEAQPKDRQPRQSKQDRRKKDRSKKRQAQKTSKNNSAEE